MNYWWVNQNQTYVHEVGGGYLWSPKVNANGRRNRFYDAMTEAAPGDVVFSFCDTYIKAVGIVISTCQSSPKPTEFGTAGEYWANEGWYLPVRFTAISRPIRPKDHMDTLAATLPEKYSPLQANGNGNQVVYLAPVAPAMASELSRLLNGQVEDVILAYPLDDDLAADAAEKAIREDVAIPVTEREQLVKARVGQGLYRSRVELIEAGCRLTGVTDRRFLRASHIKPWSKSDSREKLDGNNGLLLAPHIDHLFDKGFISFGDDGRLLKSDALPRSVQDAWGLSLLFISKSFTASQSIYMAYHRENVFLG
jgi:putative restriction endonuclease